MLKWLFLVIAVYVLFRLFAGDRKKQFADKLKQEEKLAATGEMVKDPVCGVFVPLDGGIRVREGDVVHCFCSYQCRDRYIQKIQAGDASDGSTDRAGHAEGDQEQP